VSSPALIQPLVLVVDDSREPWLPFQSAMASHGLRVVYAPTGSKLLAGAMAYEPDLVLVDAASARFDVVDVVARVRERTEAPIVAVLGDGGERSRTAALEAGVDDYVAKPFAASDLLARMRVWLTRGARTARAAQPAEPAASASASGVRLDVARRALFVEGRQVHITPVECRVLTALSRTPRGGLGEDDLVEAIWGRGDVSLRYYLRSHLRQLRKKIERDPDHPAYLVTEAGGRYRLRAR
jgi:two-component system KDP operon response regulator KdpE